MYFGNLSLALFAALRLLNAVDYSKTDCGCIALGVIMVAYLAIGRSRRTLAEDMMDDNKLVEYMWTSCLPSNVWDPSETLRLVKEQNMASQKHIVIVGSGLS